MVFQANPRQALVLWRLLITGEVPAQSKVLPELKPSERQEMVKAGLIELIERKELVEQGILNLKGRAKHIVITDKAWDWAIENFNVELSKSSAASFVLRELLIKLSHHLQSREIALAELLSPQVVDSSNDGGSDSIEANATRTNLETAIRNAYAKLSDGSGVGVLLAALRRNLNLFPREAIDNTFRQMQLERKLILMSIDDPQTITLEDEEAAISISGENCHIIYLKD